MDRKHRVLEYGRSAIEARIRDQVDTHVRPDGHQTAQRMEASDQEIMLFQKS